MEIAHMSLPRTHPSAYPKTLYRVVHSSQHTLWDPTIGFRALDQFTTFSSPIPNPNPDLPSTSNNKNFLTFLTLHFRQGLHPSPFISFFEDKKEAHQWCLAAEQVTGFLSQIAILDMRAKVMRDGIKAGVIKGWRVNDLRSKLGSMDAEGVMGKMMDSLAVGGDGSMARTEWVFLSFVPAAAVRYGETSTRLKSLYALPKIQRMMNCDCGEEFDVLKKHHCLRKQLGFSETWLDCDCASSKVCVHFDWPEKEDEILDPRSAALRYMPL